MIICVLVGGVSCAQMSELKAAAGATYCGNQLMVEGLIWSKKEDIPRRRNMKGGRKERLRIMASREEMLFRALFCSVLFCFVDLLVSSHD